MTEEQDKPIVTLQDIVNWLWGFFESLGIICALLLILWVAGKVH